MAPTENNHRRATDNWVNKLTKYALLVGTMAGLVVASGSLVWVKKDAMDSRCLAIENRINSNEKDVVEMKTDIKYIVKMIEAGQCGIRERK